MMRLFKFNPMGLGLLIAIPLLVVGWHLAALACRPAHFNSIVAELGSVRRTFLNPVPNDAGTRMLVERDMDQGWGLYLCDVPAGRRKLIYEQKAAHIGNWGTEFTASTFLLGWSPDDKWVAYGRKGKSEIVVCDGNSGEEVAVLPAPLPMASGVWLSSETIICAGQDKEKDNWVYEFRKENGQWQRPRLLKAFLKSSQKWKRERSPIEQLTALSENEVLWRQGSTLWACQAGSDFPRKLWGSETNVLKEFSFSQSKQKFLLHCADKQGEFFATFEPGKRSSDNELADIVRVDAAECSALFLRMINDGNGYAFLAQKPNFGGVSLVVKPDSKSKPLSFPWRERTSGLAVSRREVFVVANRGDEPPGVWVCDPSSGSLENVLPSASIPFRFAKNGSSLIAAITNAAGEKLEYCLIRPGEDSRTGKRPLVIDAQGIAGYGKFFFWGISWDWPQAATVNAGAFYLNVNRSGRDYSQWADDILSVYGALRANPEIDTNRVFLVGQSAGGGIVNRLLDSHPELWRGAFFCGATPGQDPSRLRVKKVIIDGGRNDGQFGGEGLPRLQHWQDEAAKNGIITDLAVHRHLGHVYRSPALETMKIKQLMLLISEN